MIAIVLYIKKRRDVYQSILALEGRLIVLITAYQSTLLLFQVLLKMVNLVVAPQRLWLYLIP